ncbi:hypothetical protein AX16_009681 [Volvariella volvacea WC 439]|nr:hypothetical protein AX16_009681 [Volvariella volvacea WC 439]
MLPTEDPSPSTLLRYDDTTRRRLDRDIARFDDIARQLKLHRNSMAYINMIHLEILTNIFSLAIKIYNHSAQTSFRILFTHLSIIQVCHHWRVAAFNCPSLWREIRFSSATWARTFLERSQNMPLSVQITRGVDPGEPGTKKVVRAVFNRIESLHICRPKGQYLRRLGQPAPILQDLNLKGFSAKRAFPLSKTIFQGHVPRLKRLSLRHCNFEWDHFLLNIKSLTKLEIAAPVNPPTFTRLVSLFRDMPLLKELHLESCNSSTKLLMLISSSWGFRPSSFLH